MSVIINGSTGVTTPGISNSEGYTGDGLTIAAGVSSGAVVVASSGNVGIGTTSPSNQLTVGANGTSTISLDWTGDNLPKATFSANHVSGEVRVGATNNSGTYFLTLYSQNAERARIDSSGNLLVGTTSGGERLSVAAPQDCASFKNTGGTGKVYFLNSSASTIGSITWTGSTTSYATSSDYRLKENIQPMTGALAKVAALKPVAYKWKADGSDGEGFIAHELAEVVPQCVTGEKDAVEVVDVKDEDGNVIGTEERPVYQGIDTSFLAATLTAAIQELKAQVDAQAVEIAALKGQA